MANLQFAEGDATAAASSLEAALRAGEERAAPPALMAWGLVRLGELRFRTGDWAAADHWYSRAVELNGDDPDAVDHKAELHAARGEYEPALKLLKAALALSPRPEFHHNLGEVYAATGDRPRALAAHRRALAAYLEAAEAGHAHYYHHLAGLYCDVDALRDAGKAEQWARKDLQLRRTSATLDALAWALYHAGDYADAAAAMDEALRDKTADAHVLYHASLIYSRAGDPEKGRLQLRRAAAANPKFNEFHFHR
jgi:tetratricopeptide (TPR) repeat protein